MTNCLKLCELAQKNVWNRKTPLEKVAYEAVRSETYMAKDDFTSIETERTNYNALFGWEDGILDKGV